MRAQSEESPLTNASRLAVWLGEIPESRIDLFLLALILVGAFFYLRTTPEFAANLPQDAADFSIPAVTFLQTGRMCVDMYGKSAPTGHPIGMPIMLLPSYIIFGHFIGNGIYTILACALGTVGLVYYVGRELAGRLCGCAAALFLISHHGFRLYSQKIMSEVPALFLVTSVLALLFYAHKHPLRHWPYFAAGIAVGLAMIVRSENLLLALPIALLAAIHFIKIDLRRAALLLIGALPWLILQALYNNTYYGSPLRTGYHWIGWFVEPSFALHNATAHGYWTLTRHYPEQFAARMDGNFLLTIKTFLNQVDQSLAFSMPVVNNGPRQVYRLLVVLRTLLGFTGLAFCLCWAGKKISAKAFGLWFAVVTLTTLIFYTFFSWQEERYIIRLLPILCILDGLGVAGILTVIRRWPAVVEAEAGFLATVAMTAVPVLMAGMSAAGMVYRGDDNLLLYEVMHGVAGMIEPNAIIVSDWDPVRIEIHMVRGTARSMIPLAKRFGYDRWPRDNAPAVPMYPFAAAEQPEQLMALMERGRPAYVLLRDPFDFQPSPPELQQLSQYWHLQPLATFNTPQGQSIGHYLLRLQSRTSTPPSQ